MRAEYDHRNNRVVSIEMDDGRVVGTHNPRVLGAPTRWVPVEVEYPDGYDQRFHRLLQPQEVQYTYEERGNRVVVTYPDADFSPERVRDELRLSVKNSARTALNRTDWYLLRKIELGTEVPADVLEERAAIRDKADAYEAEIAKLPDSKLSDFVFTFTTQEPMRRSAAPAGPVEGGDGREWVTNASSPDEKGAQVRPASEDEIQPFDAKNTRGVVDPPVEGVPTGLPWSIEEHGTK